MLDGNLVAADNDTTITACCCFSRIVAEDTSSHCSIVVMADKR